MDRLGVVIEAVVCPDGLDGVGGGNGDWGNLELPFGRIRGNGYYRAWGGVIGDDGVNGDWDESGAASEGGEDIGDGGESGAALGDGADIGDAGRSGMALVDGAVIGDAGGWHRGWFVS